MQQRKIRKILVVDNDPVILKLMTNLLQEHGYEIQTSRDGLEAVMALKDFHPDVIFVDWIMPNINGEGFCKIIREKEIYDGTLLVIMSGIILEEKIDLRQLRADACIAKGPFKKTGEIILKLLQDFKTGHNPDAGLLGLDDLHQRQITKELLASLRHKEVIQDNISEGVLELSPYNTIVSANRSARALLGLQENDLICADLAEILESDLTPLKTSAIFHHELENIYLKNKKYLHFKILPLPESTNAIAIIQDVTDLLGYERGLLESEEQYRDLFENSSDLIQIISPEGRFMYVNDAWKEAMQYEEAELEKLSIFDLVKEDYKKMCVSKFREVLNGKRLKHIEVVFLAKDGQELILEGNVNCRFRDGRPVSTQGIFRDMTKRKDLEDKLHRLSITDELTGLLNRRGFMTMAEKQLQIAVRNRNTILLFFLDLDDLKFINDRFGHGKGDEALTEMAAILKATFRQADIIGRLGGDEFAVLQTHICTPAESRASLKRLQENIASFNARSRRDYVLSVSVGLVTYDSKEPSSLGDLMSKADLLMYKEKLGKNRCQRFLH
ncbi:MAG: diguanylate cyclase [Deltaproteobacteria bacterium]|jgi:diguanylate cyclase (GGDEF)-like protein/PAS domain S-box-containing protein